MQIQLKKLSGDATIPVSNSPDNAGYDLFATEDYTLKPLERKLFKTDIAISIPTGYYGRIAPRSGLAYKNGIDVMGGVIDSNYRGNVGVILVNLKAPAPSDVRQLSKTILEQMFPTGEQDDFEVKKGDRIAQIIIEAYQTVEWQEVEELETSDRNEGGFGSTGK